jgi:hypothetical protein
MFSRRPWMTPWYSPRLLMKAGFEVLVSTLFGQHADQRMVQALAKPAEIYSYRSGKLKKTEIHQPVVMALSSEISEPETGTQPHAGDFWIDYVADVGDGWDSTYSAAYLATRPKLRLRDPHGGEHDLCAGRLLIFGGDQVYPTASRQEYDRRFLAPYQAAWSDGHPRAEINVFAIPGNHDWYDSLKSFSRIFFTKDQFVGGTHVNSTVTTPQSRSYFAIQLPQSWWLLATDVQLGSDIDANQLEYFRTVLRNYVQDGDRIIFCTAEPHWLKAKCDDKRDTIGATALDKLEREINVSSQADGDLVTDAQRHRIVVYIAGDVHHYMRFASDTNPPVQKITAGGGGAFLHPTHRTWQTKLSDAQPAPFPPQTFHRKGCFPSAKKSLALSLRNWLFALWNPSFGMLTGALYMVFTLIMLPALDRLGKNVDPQFVALTSQVQQAEVRARQLEAEIHQIAPPSATLYGTKPVDATIARNQAAQQNYFQGSDPRAVRMRLEQQFPKRPVNVTEPGAVADAPPSELPPPIISRIDEVDQLADRSSSLKMAQQQVRQQLESRDVLKSVGSLVKYDFVTSVPLYTGQQSTNGPIASDGLGGDAGGELGANDGTSIEPQPAAEPPLRRTFRAARQFGGVLSRLLVQEAKLPEPFESLLGIVIYLAAIGGFIAFTDVPEPSLRAILGFLHGTAHWLAAFALALYGSALLDVAPRATAISLAVAGSLIAAAYVWSDDTPGRSAIAKLLSVIAMVAVLVCVGWIIGNSNQFRRLGIIEFVLVGGWLVGATIMGGYLFLTHLVSGRHWNESFSSIRCKDWKNFVRFKIGGDGSLTIYPIGIPRVCRRWKTSAANPDHVEPVQVKLLPRLLIEDPIVIPP